MNRIWSYPKPTAGTSFAPLKDHLSFYAASSGSGGGAGWKCFVEGEEVTPQAGDVSAVFSPCCEDGLIKRPRSQFYGGWVTAEIEGKMKGGPGTMGW